MSFEFQQGDAEGLRDLCTRARKKAANNPCYQGSDALNPDFSFRFGPYNISFTLDAWEQPTMWHGSVCLLQQVAEQPTQLPSGLIAMMPVDSVVALEAWDTDNKQQAEFLLGELMGPFIQDEQQEVNVHSGLLGLHFRTKRNK